jgi:steroid delta-isomerase-like uncharacterized protein
MPGAGKEATMSVEQNKEIVRRFAEVWNGGNTAVVDELGAPDLVVQYPLLPAPLHGPRAFREFLGVFQAAFPDIRLTLDAPLIAEGDQVAARWTLRGTQRGDMPGLPASGKVAEWSGISIYRLRDGKVAEERGEEDALGLLRQLGAIPQ